MNPHTDWFDNIRPFIGIPDDQLASVDIGELNLICAKGLKHSEGLDVAQGCQILDRWAQICAAQTERWLPRFRSSPEKFNNSEQYFRVLSMVTTVQRDLGARYESSIVDDPIDYRDSRLWFIHGALMGIGGTCASLPILIIAIGRRLGYPLKLVAAYEHLFVRWGAMNIEATNKGLNCHPDEFYRRWPSPITDEEIHRGVYLRPKTPREELACSLATRGHCLLQFFDLKGALEAYHYARVLAPRDPHYNGFSAIATIIFRLEQGRTIYDMEEELVDDLDGIRPMKSWEKWAVPEGIQVRERIITVLEGRREQKSIDHLIPEPNLI